MEIINYFIAFIIGVFFTLIIFFIRAITEDKKPKNKVHFYVARDKSGGLYLYLGKPSKEYTYFYGNLDKGSITLTNHHFFNKLGLNKYDYAKLEWEDGPVEVFLNMED